MTYIILNILFSLLITMIAYGSVPLILARARKKNITKRKYRLLCFCINFPIMVLFAILRFINGDEAFSVFPYFLWTLVFSRFGIKMLTKRGILEGAQPIDSTETPTNQASKVIDCEGPEKIDMETKNSPKEEKLQIRFCRKCGFELVPGSDFCSKCGTAVVRES